jgi:purine-binding chemotaxis protein CheW
VNAPTPAGGNAWCTFQLAGGDYGVELSRVQEVLRSQPVTRLPDPASPPGAPPSAIVGLINLRGRIVPVVDPRVVLGGASDGAPGSGFVVVSSTDGPVALLVDAIGDVRRADDAQPPPSLIAETSTGSAGAEEGSLIARTLALPGQLLVELNLDRVLARAFAMPGTASRLRPRPDGTPS